MKDPSMAAIRADVGKLELEFVQCHLNVSTPYLVNLTLVGEDAAGAAETATGVMWTSHQLPPPPDLAKIVSVTQTTITLTLPSVTLTQGPPTGLEIRIKPAETNGSREERKARGFLWAQLLKRHKRNTDNLQSPRTDHVSSEGLLQWEVPPDQDGVQDVSDTGAVDMEQKQSTGLQTDNQLESRETKYSEQAGFKATSERLSRDRESYKGNTRDDVKQQATQAEVTAHRPRPETYEVNLPVQTEVTAHRPKPETYEVNLPVQTKVTAHRSRPDDNSHLQSRGRQATSGDLMESKAINNDRLHHKITNFTSAEDNHGRSQRERLAFDEDDTDITGLETDGNADLQTIDHIYRWSMRNGLFQPSSREEDVALLQRLAENVGELQQPDRFSDISSLNVLHVSSPADDMPDTGGFNTACTNCGRHRNLPEYDFKAGSSPQLSPRPPSPNLPDLSSTTKMSDRDILAATSKHTVSRSTGQWTSDASRRKRSILGFGRPRKRQLREDAVREADDGLEVDPYQTWEVRISATGQPHRVKTGCGYFITDHYGVRHPYFNNSRLERALRRHAYYQEARDLVVYGKSLLNLTDFKDLDLGLLYSRLGKVMEVNRSRRGKLFLDMFEDFLFFKQDRGHNLLGGNDIPPEAKLGLPPGVPVARLMTQNLSQTVTIGDNSQHDQLPNPPLEPGTEYEVVVVVLSTVVDVTKHSWISFNVSTLAEQPSRVPVPFLLLAVVAASGGLLVALAHVILWCTGSRPVAPPAGVCQDVHFFKNTPIV